MSASLGAAEAKLYEQSKAKVSHLTLTAIQLKLAPATRMLSTPESNWSKDWYLLVLAGLIIGLAEAAEYSITESCSQPCR